MRIKTPKIPDPVVIHAEIRRLKSRIGELRALLHLAEVQRLARSLSPPEEPERAASPAPAEGGARC